MKHDPITVDVNEWLKERQAGPSGLTYPGAVGPSTTPEQINLPADASPEERERIRELQEELREKWRVREEIGEREHLLDNISRECVECHTQRRHYRDDYICYRCRDAKGEDS